MTPAPQNHIDGQALSVLLDRSAPETPLSDAVPGDALREMVRSAELEARRTRRRMKPRAVAVATVIALGIGGAGAAAAATLTDWRAWVPWVENPDAAVHFTLPSGTACEFRVAVRSGDPADIRVLQDVLRTPDLLARADIDSELARITATNVVIQHADGDSIVDGETVVPATELYSEDELYEQGVTGAINNVIWDEMAARGITGFSDHSELSYGGQSDCAGMSR